MHHHVCGFRCVLCGAEYPPSQALYVCPHHGDHGILDVVYDYPAIRRAWPREALAQDRARSMWRYRPLLPVEPDSSEPPLTVGWTPLYGIPRLASQLGLRALWLKDEGRNPTASLKDRASAVALVRAQEQGRRCMTAASTGNAASSLAGLAASVGMETVIFVPAAAPRAKMAQLLVYGATLVAVEGDYDQAYDLCLEATRRYGWYSRNTAFNPYLSEGKKTAALEICEQLGWQAPDRVFVAVGDGCIIGGLWKGFRDLLALGFIERLPRLFGVQAQGAAVLAEAWARGSEEVRPQPPSTLADSIAVGLPRDRVKALRAVRESGGAFVTVSDAEILEAMRALGRQTGVFGEPAGVAGFAGLCRLAQAGDLHADEQVVVLVTGNGLKDVDSAMKAGGVGHRMVPTAEALTELVERLHLDRR
ncbi:MAG: threonine synthase [Chloroflexi bacterium]|nr:threonine synthase [Chloroflexota bacterium]